MTFEFARGEDFEKLPRDLQDKLVYIFHAVKPQESVSDLLKFLPEEFEAAETAVIARDEFPTSKFSSRWPITCPGQNLEEVAAIVANRRCAMCNFFD